MASRGCRFREGSLLAQAEALDERAVRLDVGALEVVEQPATLAHELEEPAAGMEILRVLLEMLGEHVDALGLDRDLDFRRSGIALSALVIADDARLVCSGDGHEFVLRSLLESSLE